MKYTYNEFKQYLKDTGMMQITEESDTDGNTNTTVYYTSQKKFYNPVFLYNEFHVCVGVHFITGNFYRYNETKDQIECCYTSRNKWYIFNVNDDSPLIFDNKAECKTCIKQDCPSFLLKQLKTRYKYLTKEQKRTEKEIKKLDVLIKEITANKKAKKM